MTVTRADLTEAVYQEVGLSRNESAQLVVYRTRFLGHKFVSCGGPE